MSTRDRRQRLVERHQRVGHAHDAAPVAERLVERLPERDADVLDRVVLVDVQVALGLDAQVEQPVLADLLDEVVEHADARLRRRTARCHRGRA